MTGVSRNMHLVQLNVARARHGLDDPRLADFMNNLDRINGLADRSPGFVWRLKDEGGNATDIAFNDDPMMIVNLSVWADVASLENFVWNTLHRRFYERRAEWFEALDSMHLAMWWVPEGHIPTVAEARERLEHLNAQGDSEQAFGWAYLKDAHLWKAHKCDAIAAE